MAILSAHRTTCNKSADPQLATAIPRHRKEHLCTTQYSTLCTKKAHRQAHYTMVAQAPVALKAREAAMYCTPEVVPQQVCPRGRGIDDIGVACRTINTTRESTLVHSGAAFPVLVFPQYE